VTDNDEIDISALSEAIIAAFDRLPILARLEFVRDLLLNNGGEKRSFPQDPRWVVAAEVVRGVIEILEKRPRAAKLNNPEP
jgi:hypothetical protein